MKKVLTVDEQVYLEILLEYLAEKLIEDDEKDFDTLITLLKAGNVLAALIDVNDATGGIEKQWNKIIENIEKGHSHE